jgi:hypothetical protein
METLTIICLWSKTHGQPEYKATSTPIVDAAAQNSRGIPIHGHENGVGAFSHPLQVPETAIIKGSDHECLVKCNVDSARKRTCILRIVHQQGKHM